MKQSNSSQKDLAVLTDLSRQKEAQGLFNLWEAKTLGKNVLLLLADKFCNSEEIDSL